MNQMTAEPIPPELQALMDAEIALETSGSPREQQRILSLLGAMPGVQEPALYGGLLVFRFDPESTTKAEICDALQRAGFKVSWAKVAPASPIADAVHP